MQGFPFISPGGVERSYPMGGTGSMYGERVGAGSKGGERPLQYSVKRKPVLGPPMMDLLWLCQ